MKIRELLLSGLEADPVEPKPAAPDQQVAQAPDAPGGTVDPMGNSSSLASKLNRLGQLHQENDEPVAPPSGNFYRRTLNPTPIPLK